MNILPSRLEAFGLSFARYALAVVLLGFGLLKFTAYEAHGVEPLFSHSPFFAWAYKLVGLRTLSKGLGVTEIVTGLLLAARRFSPLASVLGGLVAIVMFCTTGTFMLTTPGVWEPGYGFPFPSVALGEFLVKDLVYLGVALLLTGESWRGAWSLKQSTPYTNPQTW